MLQIWGSVHLSAPTCKLEAVAQRQRDLTGIDAPQTREKQKLLRTFGCATGLPRSQPGASLARGATRGVSPGDPCSGFSPCLRHPKKTPSPGAADTQPWSGHGENAGIQVPPIMLGAAAPRGLSFPAAGARCCTLFVFLWNYPPCWLPLLQPPPATSPRG